MSFSPRFLRAARVEQRRVERIIDRLDMRIEQAQKPATKDRLSGQRAEAVRALKFLRERVTRP